MIDSHCHLHHTFDKIDCSAEELIRNTLNELDALLNVAITWEDHDTLIDIAKAHPRIFSSLGQHPSDTDDENLETVISFMDQALHQGPFIAVGETGLDFYHPHDQAKQEAFFREQIKLAIAHNKPLIIHTRQAREATIAILKEEQAEKVGGIFHCFTESWDMAKEGLAMGFYISFSGIISFKNAKEVQAVAKQVPLDRLLIETDAPYLAPVPFRGKTNQPLYVKHVANALALLRDQSVASITKQTSENFYRLFPQACG